jgi:two-component system OmpR family sensor kinase
VSSLLATTALRGFLVDRIDEQLAGASRMFDHLPSRPPPAPPSGAQDVRPPSRFYLELVSADASAVTVLSTPEQDGGVVPDIPSPAELPLLTGAPFTTGSVDSGEQWRMQVFAVGSGSGWAVAAFPLTDVQATVGRLVLLQLVVGLAVVALAGSLGYVFVRRSLFPLDHMASTAHQIAAGDLSLRVSEDGSSSEIEELATSFNTMVTRIEASFSAQQASETEARASEERMRRFVADAGHELRTPLTSIRGYAELLEQGAADDPAQALGRIQQEATRMGGLVNDLSLLARLDQQPVLDLQRIHMRDIVDSAVEGARAVQPDRPIVVSCSDDQPVVTVDGRQLRQVVDNLLSNALRYSTPNSQVDVVIDRAADQIRVSVLDHGVGLTADDLSHVFERLYRTDQARSRVSGGTGLGLAIVKSIVEAHGGTVFATSVVGTGSTFGFEVPATKD